MDEDKVIGIVIGVGIVIVGLVIFFTLTPAGRIFWNTNMHAVQKADDVTRYETKKHVEDTCRAMISSYTSDKLIWTQYKDNDGEKLSWAEQAKMRANKTAASYNEYVLKNSYVWNGNIPSDIKTNLPYIGE